MRFVMMMLLPGVASWSSCAHRRRIALCEPGFPQPGYRKTAKRPPPTGRSTGSGQTIMATQQRIVGLGVLDTSADVLHGGLKGIAEHGDVVGDAAQQHAARQGRDERGRRIR